MSLFRTHWPCFIEPDYQHRYESIRERIKDTFASSANPTIIRSVSTILQVYISLQQDFPSRFDNKPRGSSQSTLNDRNDDPTSASLEHLSALDDLEMRGLSWRLTFISLQREEDRHHVFGMIKELVGLLS